MSNTSLNLLVHSFNYSIADLENFQLNAAESALLPAHKRTELKASIRRRFGSRLDSRKVP